MRMGLRAALAATLYACVSVIATAAGKPADELAGTIKALMPVGGGDWDMIEDVRQIKWAPLPPKELDNCLPDGGCFTRAGSLAAGGQPVGVIATGARTIVSNFYMRNTGPAIGEAALVSALGAAGLAPALARCPVNPSDPVHFAKWWRVKSGAFGGFVSLTHSSGAKKWEGIGYHASETLPALEPNEVKSYSEQCAGGKSATPVATQLPHEAIAQILTAYIPAGGTQGYDWASLKARAPAVKWNPAPYKMDATLAFDDPNPFMLSGQGVTVSTRSLSNRAHGTEKLVKTVHLEENGMHPKGEEALFIKALQNAGFAVSLARCGKPYTEAKYTYYRVRSAKTASVYMLLNERFEGVREQSGYHLYIDGALPALKPGETNVGAGNCR